MTALAVPSSRTLSEVLREYRAHAHPILPVPGTWIPLDLSSKNESLQKLGIFNTTALTSYLFSEISSRGGSVGYGGYNEERSWYQRSKAFTDNEEPRTIHLGIDLWCQMRTPCYAPLDGVVHSFADNAAFGDYGPTIILQHCLEDQRFYTLYGHLTQESLEGVTQGMRIRGGQQIGSVGSPPTNGDWPPHLHFQIISNMLGLVGDFPGVAARSRRDYFLSLCPDPSVLIVR